MHSPWECWYTDNALLPRYIQKLEYQSRSTSVNDGANEKDWWDSYGAAWEILADAHGKIP